MSASPAVCQVNDCGVLAIGRCLNCGLAYCQTHERVTTDIRRVGDMKRCSSCADPPPPDPPHMVKWREEVPKRRLEWEPKVVEALMAISDPVERVVRAAGQVLLQDRYVPSLVDPRRRQSWQSAGSWGHEAYAPSTPELRALCKEPPWDDVQIASWFARAAITEAWPLKFDGVKQKRSLRRSRPRAGWRLDLKMDDPHRNPVYQGPFNPDWNWKSPQVVIYENGEIGCEPPDYQPIPNCAGVLTVYAMHMMCGCREHGTRFANLPDFDLPRLEEPTLVGGTSHTP